MNISTKKITITMTSIALMAGVVIPAFAQTPGGRRAPNDVDLGGQGDVRVLSDVTANRTMGSTTGHATTTPMRDMRSNIDDNGKGNLNNRPWSDDASTSIQYQNGNDVKDFGFNQVQDANQGKRIGFLRGIGNFLKRIFGF